MVIRIFFPIFLQSHPTGPQQLQKHPGTKQIFVKYILRHSFHIGKSIDTAVSQDFRLNIPVILLPQRLQYFQLPAFPGSAGRLEPVRIPFQKTDNLAYISISHMEDFLYLFPVFPVKTTQNPFGFPSVIEAFRLILAILRSLCQTFFTGLLLFLCQHTVISVSELRCVDIYLFPFIPAFRLFLQSNCIFSAFPLSLC